MQDSQSTACIVCTPEGNIFAWPKLSQSQDQEPLQARISQEITCLSDIIVVEHQPTLAIFAILGTADGRLYKLDCINPGTSTEAIAVIPLQPEVTTSQLITYNPSHIRWYINYIAHGHTCHSLRLLSAERFVGGLWPVLGETCIARCQGSSDRSAAPLGWARCTDPGTQQTILGLLAGELC